MCSVADKLRENLTSVRHHINDAARRSRRAADEVRFVAVTKQVSVSIAQQLVNLGLTDLGENRPQELWRKAEQITGPVQWHLIGHLQRNKSRRSLPLVTLIHSVDSLALLNRINELAMELDLQAVVLLEVNVSGEEAKHGFSPYEMDQVIERAGELRRLRIDGLMTMAPFDPDPEQARPTFVKLRELRDRLRSNAPINCPLAELSMGMSGDFVVAIEGATMVRIGSALFEGLDEAAG